MTDNRRMRLGEALTRCWHAALMKRILATALLALTAIAPAYADTLAAQVKAEAQRLLVQVSAAESAAKVRPGAKPPAVAPALASDLQRFSLAASRLSVEIDQRGGPTDLRCIFRGMAEETGKQLDAAAKATTGGDQAKAYARLTYMLKDAVEIAPAVGGNATAASSARAAAATCPASKDF